MSCRGQRDQHVNDFSYKDIPLTSGSGKLIRAFTLYRGRPDDPIEGRLGVVPLESSPHYEALSYVWGSSSKHSEIQISGKRLAITTNLASALQHIRRTDKDRELWIDAICINQANIPERNQQVAIMGSIYRQASRVLIYVGERTAEGDLALDATERLGRVSSTADNRPRPDEEFNELLADARRLGSPTEEEWKALRGFYLERPYFTRAWVVQEAALAREAVLMCGDRTLSWTTIQNIRAAYEGLWGWLSGTVRRLNEVFAVAWSMHRRAKPANPWIKYEHMPRLEHYLWKFAANRCSDEHDFLYAYLGLVELEKGSIEIDYAKSRQEAYTEATRAMILESRDLLPICMTRRCGRSLDALPDLPSWVPDWSSSPRCDLIVEGDEDVQLFYADGREMKISEGTIRFLVGATHDFLLIEGATIDKIRSVCEGIEMGEENWEAKAKKWIPRDLGSQPYTGVDGKENDAIDIFWKTILKYTHNAHYKECRPGRRWHPEHYRYLFKQWAGLPVSEDDRERARKRVRNRKGDDEIDNWIETSFTQCLEGFLHGWTLCTTSNSLWALVPFDSQADDVIAVVRGASVPLVLRPSIGDGYYRLVGTAYMQGVMGREFMGMMERGEVKERQYEIR